MADNQPSKSTPRIALSLAIEFDQRVFRSIVSRFGVGAWNHWVGRLLNADLTAAAWPAGTHPPPVTVFFRFTEDLRVRWPEADFSAVWFVADDGKEQEGRPELFVIPVEEIPLTADVTCLIDRS